MTSPPTVPDDASWHRVHPVPTGEAPRYRVLATPARSDRSGYVRVTGFVLVVTRVDAAWRRLVGDRAHAPLVTTWARPNHAGALDPATARAVVVRHLVDRARPLPCAVTPADVELYVRLDDAP